MLQDHLVLDRAPSADPDPAFVARLLLGMPTDLAQRLDARLIFALHQALGPWDGVERRRGWHCRLPLPFGTWRLSCVRERPMGHRNRAAGRAALMGALGACAVMGLVLAARYFLG